MTWKDVEQLLADLANTLSILSISCGLYNLFVMYLNKTFKADAEEKKVDTQDNKGAEDTYGGIIFLPTLTEGLWDKQF